MLARIRARTPHMATPILSPLLTLAPVGASLVSVRKVLQRRVRRGRLKASKFLVRLQVTGEWHISGPVDQIVAPP